jgi:hypothetical protein
MLSLLAVPTLLMVETTSAVFCRVIIEDMILMNLFMIQSHNDPMNYNYYCHWIRMTCHATTLQILYVSVVYQLDREWCPPSLGMTNFVLPLLVSSYKRNCNL